MRKVLAGTLMVLGVVVALALVLVLLSSAVTNVGSAEIASEGQVAIRAESTISSASTVRNAAVNARLIAQGWANGLYTTEELESAIDGLTGFSSQYAIRATQVIEDLEGDEEALVSDTTAVYLSAISSFITDLELSRQSFVPDGNAALEAPPIPATEYQAAVQALVDARNERVIGVLAAAEYSGQAADGIRFVVVFVIPVAALFVLRSMLKRRREREVFQAELARQRAVIDSKDEFVTNLSHELRTPLTGVYSSALVLDETGFDDPETARELTGLIVNEAGELSRMVDDLITAGQIETNSVALTIEEIELADEIATVVEPFVRTGATITFTPGEDVGEVDRLRFRQIMRNLVSNAVKHGGPNVEVFTEFGGGMVSVFVMDDGDGIPDEKLAGLFDRYQHEGDEPLLQGSVGLGLAVARALAVGMGGSLSYTRSGGLTYFVLKVPSHRVGRLVDRVDDQSLGKESASESASQVAKLFAR